MKKLKLALWGILAVMTAGLASCNSEEKQSAYDKKVEAVSKEVFKNKKHDDAILLVTFGSTWDQPQETYKKVKQDFAKKFPGRDVFFSFTSNICINRCISKGLTYYEPKFYMSALGRAGYKNIYVQSLHVVPGEEYLRVKSVIKDFYYEPGNDFAKDVKVYLGGPLLSNKEDVKNVANILAEQHAKDVEAGKIVAFMGHGNPEGWDFGNGNQKYTDLEEELQKISPNYFVATVDMEGNLVEDMIKRMEDKNFANKGLDVILQPLMSIAGDHANNDMKEDWSEALRKGDKFNCPEDDNHIILKGLSTFEKIRNIYIEHTKNAKLIENVTAEEE